MKDQALGLVRKLLARRLEAAGIRAPRPELFFQCEATEPEPYPGGTQVRVRTWRQWSEARVKLDADTGEFLGYAVDRYSDPMTRTELTQEQALQLAAGAVQLPPEAVLAGFRHSDYAPQRRLVELTWWHVHEGLRVDGDSIRVVLHPDTGRIVELERFWRTVQLR